uniref:Pentraxin family member n=1 Tax=Mandrillus leucophaeus TaxID=9568 RepID=A0A2K5XFN8_MANLE
MPLNTEVEQRGPRRHWACSRCLGAVSLLSEVCAVHPTLFGVHRPPPHLPCPPSGSSAYSPPDAFKISIPIRNNYMYARVRKALPELYAFTACMWLRSRSSGTGQGTPFSYSVPGQANEIVLLETGHEPMELLINDKVGRAGGEGWWGGRRPFQELPLHTGLFHSPAHSPALHIQHTLNAYCVPGWALGI